MAASLKLDQANAARAAHVGDISLSAGSLPAVVTSAGRAARKSNLCKRTESPVHLTPVTSTDSLSVSSVGLSPAATEDSLPVLDATEAGASTPIVIEGMLPSGMFEDEWEELISTVSSPTSASGAAASLAATEVEAALQAVVVSRKRVEVISLGRLPDESDDAGSHLA